MAQRLYRWILKKCAVTASRTLVRAIRVSVRVQVCVCLVRVCVCVCVCVCVFSDA